VPPPSPLTPPLPHPPPYPPASPGASFQPVLAFTLTVAGDLSDFNEAPFKTLLVTLLGNGITEEMVTLTLTSGSVQVDASVKAPTLAAANAASGVLGGSTPASLTSALGVSVTAATPASVSVVPVAAPEPPPPPEAPPPPLAPGATGLIDTILGLGTPVLIAIGAGALVVLLVLILVIYCFCCRSAKNNQVNA